METKKQTFKDKEFTVIKGSVHPEYSYFTFEGEERDFRDTFWDIKENDVVFDIGASYGTYTLSARSIGATVYSFEPEQTIYRDLVNNVLINNFEDKCFVSNFGLWSSNTSIDMTHYAPHWSKQTISGNYVAVTLDQITQDNEITKIDWMKIDVEGAEEEVIKGALQSIAKFKPNMIIECHTFLDPELKSKVINLISSIANYDFEDIQRDPCVMLLCKAK